MGGGGVHAEVCGAVGRRGVWGEKWLSVNPMLFKLGFGAIGRNKKRSEITTKFSVAVETRV